MTVPQHVLPRAAEANAEMPRRVPRDRNVSSMFSVGDLVEVRSQEEILATLDKNGELDKMPFMPEMLKFCGKQFHVYKRAHKSCDTVSGAYKGIQLDNAIHLDLRCDGSAHGGCQAHCMLFWRDAWLKPVGQSHAADLVAKGSRGITQQQLMQTTSATAEDGSLVYSCQTTRLLSFSTPLLWWSFGQYYEDLTSGNVSIVQLWQAFAYATYVQLAMTGRRTIGKPGRWLYDIFQKLRGGVPFPRRMGQLAPGTATARTDLNLQAGDLIRVRPYEDILTTLDTSGGNRHMQFDAEMVPYCGGTYRVRARIENFIDEKTGRMRKMKTPAVILDDVICHGCYSHHRMLCPRSIHSWWREIWLERVGPDGARKP